MLRVIIIVAILAVLSSGAAVWWNSNARQDTSSQEQTPPSESQNIYSASEVATHSTRADCWTIINSVVYDLTPYINRHPGGEEMLRACGQDATSLFTQRMTGDGQAVGSGTPHSKAADYQLSSLEIGILN